MAQADACASEGLSQVCVNAPCYAAFLTI